MENTARAKFIWNFKQGQESSGSTGGFAIPESLPKCIKKTSELLTGSGGEENSARGEWEWPPLIPGREKVFIYEP